MTHRVVRVGAFAAACCGWDHRGSVAAFESASLNAACAVPVNSLNVRGEPRARFRFIWKLPCRFKPLAPCPRTAAVPRPRSPRRVPRRAGNEVHRCLIRESPPVASAVQRCRGTYRRPRAAHAPSRLPRLVSRTALHGRECEFAEVAGIEFKSEERSKRKRVATARCLQNTRLA